MFKVNTVADLEILRGDFKFSITMRGGCSSRLGEFTLKLHSFKSKILKKATIYLLLNAVMVISKTKYEV